MRSDQRASYRHPCPICQSTSLCLRYTDNGKLALCQNPPVRFRLESHKRVVFGRDFWLVPLGAEGEVPAKEVKRVEPWHGADRAHLELLRLLEINNFWTKHLLARGFTEDEIEFFGYRSTPRNIRGLVKALYPRYKEVWEQIPGFVKGPKLMLRPNQLVIPIRDHRKGISGIQLRNKSGRPKYCWFSSGGLGGTPIHHNVGSDVLLLTEGPLKADYVHCKRGWSTLSYQGVSTINAEKLYDELIKIERPRVAYVANDSDLLTNKAVYDGALESALLLESMGIDTYVLLWDDEKGIDDLLLKGGPLYKLSVFDFSEKNFENRRRLAPTRAFRRGRRAETRDSSSDDAGIA